MKLIGRRNLYFPKYMLKKANELLQNGYFIRIPTCCDFVWGISAFRTSDSSIVVKRLEGRFLGGGICESYGYKVKLGEKEFWCANLYYAIRSVLGYIEKHEHLQGFL
jgi:hypothetical protein